jgi:integrase
MPRPKPRKLTEAYVRGLQPGTTSFTVRDTSVTGLFVEVNKTCISYKVQRDLWVGERGRRRLAKTVRKTLGTTDDLALDTARTRALELIAQIKRGEDPNARPVIGADTASWTVERMFKEYRDDMLTRECRQRSADDIEYRMNLYLGDWLTTPIMDIKKSACRERHAKLSKERGKRVANQAFKDFRAAYNLALRVVDDPDALPANPTTAITWNKERASDRVIMPEDLPAWWDKLATIPNPIRRAMHEFGLLSGLRPGTLVSIRRDWIDLAKCVIHLPRMKSGRPFDLPLSAHMIDVVKRALKAGDIVHPGSVWLFPTRNKAGELCATQVWKEKALPSETGHLLRHTYRTVAKRAGVDQIDARLLLDHTVPGIDGVYIHSHALFDRLLAVQEVMSKTLMELCTADQKRLQATSSKRI